LPRINWQHSGLAKKISDLSGPSRIEVAPDEEGRRLDNWLMSRLKGVPRSRVYRMIRGGEVRINGGRARPDTRVAAGDEIRLPPVRMAEGGDLRPPPVDRMGWIAARIVYEDSDLLVLDKPAGLAAHGGSGVSWGAIELLRAARPGDAYLELAHRLDRDTSGCLLVARRRPALRRLHALFRDNQIRKAYTALLLGRLLGDQRVVDAPLRTTERRGGERTVSVAEDGKPARTRFQPQRRYAQATLAEVLIDTGRTHQIRVHAAHIGHPVAGDSRYGADADPIVARFGLRRLFLHASSLTFDSPKGDRVIRVEAPLDDELRAVLARLES
jgi:23S rRNA pseudouridine955/2504/2580 synthase